MKICQACQTQYSDDEQQFCFQDGTLLTFMNQADIQTVVLNETETATVRGQMHQPSTWQQAPAQPQKTGSKMAVAIAATVFAMLLLFAAGIGAWFYFKSAQTETAKSTTNKNSAIQSPNLNTRTSPTLQISSTATPSSTRASNTSVPTTDVDESEERNEVFQKLSTWKSSAESLDLDENIAHYAGTVDYYNKSGASSAFVRADKLKAFTRYDSINIKLTNVSINVDTAGEEATVTLDKEWNFEGAKNSRGKVKQSIKMRKIDGQWLITAEKDLQVYFTR
ncbi:MAG: hypothetical protein ACKVRN_01760 [Pyrinomonadaceae bacterium]